MAALDQNKKSEVFEVETPSSQTVQATNPRSEDQFSFSFADATGDHSEPKKKMRFHCFMCDYKTYHKSVFEEHLRVHRGIKPYKCTHCDYRSSSKKNAKNHEAVHRPDNPMKCKQCEFYARNLPNLRKHVRDNHMIKNAIGNCSLCDIQYDDVRHKLYHENKWLKCKKCMYTACGAAMLKSHMVTKHKVKLVKNKSNVSFTCKICQWESNTKTKILLHLIHHPDQTVDDKTLDLSILRKYKIVA